MLCWKRNYVVHVDLQSCFRNAHVTCSYRIFDGCWKFYICRRHINLCVRMQICPENNAFS